MGFYLRLSCTAHRMWRVVWPLMVTTPHRPKEERTNLEDCLLSPLVADWEAMVESADVGTAWAYWTWAAEEALLALSDPRLQTQQVECMPFACCTELCATRLGHTCDSASGADVPLPTATHGLAGDSTADTHIRGRWSAAPRAQLAAHSPGTSPRAV